MAHAPWDRYESCAEFADDIDRFLAGDLIHGRAIGVVERISAFFSKKHPNGPWIITGAVTAASVFLLLTILVIRDQFLFRKLDSQSVVADISKVSNAESMSSEDIAQLFDNYEPEKPEASQPKPKKIAPNPIRGWP